MSGDVRPAPPRARTGWRAAVATVAPPVVLLVVFLTVWETASRSGLLHPVLYPPPTAVAAALGRLLTSAEFFRNYWVTIQEIAGGFALGAVVGFVFGSLFTVMPRLSTVFYPYFVAFQALPKIVLAPLFIVWLGFGPVSKIVMAMTISFFPVLINTMLGLSLVDEDRLRLMRSLLADERQIFFKLKLPGATPAIFAGVKTGLTLAVFGAIAAELVGATAGVGIMLSTYNGLIRVDYVLALVATLGAFGLVVYIAMEKLDSKITFWARQEGDGS